MLRLADACPDIRITAVDGSAAMIELATQAVRAASHEARIVAMQGYIPGLALREHGFDAILSKDLLHHLPDPMVLWREARRLGRQGAAVYVMDLIRPATPKDARNIVETVAPRASNSKGRFLQLVVRGFHDRRGRDPGTTGRTAAASDPD